jgi:four helix bundle protein
LKIKNYQELNIWKRSVEIAIEIYNTSKNFPKEELYGLTSQIRRASVSIPSNIAEGFTRYHNKEFRQFLYVSLGSCAEVETQLFIAQRLNYIDQEKASKLVKELGEIGKMINNLIKKINNTLC